MNFFLNMISPLDQFEIRNLLNINAPFLGNLPSIKIELYLSAGISIIALLVIIVILIVNKSSLKDKASLITQQKCITDSNEPDRQYTNLILYKVSPGSVINGIRTPSSSPVYFLADLHDKFGRSLYVENSSLLLGSSMRTTMHIPGIGLFIGIVSWGPIGVTEYNGFASLGHDTTVYASLLAQHYQYKSQGIPLTVRWANREREYFPDATPSRLGSVILRRVYANPVDWSRGAIS